MGYLAIGQLCKLKAIGQPNGLFYEYPAPWLVKRFFPGEKKPSMLGSSQEKMRHFLALVSPHQFKQIMLCCKSWSAKDTPLVKEILILERSFYHNESAYLFAFGSTSQTLLAISGMTTIQCIYDLTLFCNNNNACGNQTPSFIVRANLR